MIIVIRRLDNKKYNTDLTLTKAQIYFYIPHTLFPFFVTIHFPSALLNPHRAPMGATSSFCVTIYLFIKIYVIRLRWFISRRWRGQVGFDYAKIAFWAQVKASGAEAFRLYEPNLLAFVLNKFDFWGPKCPNYENIEF